MTTYAFPSIVPTASTWSLESNTGVHTAPSFAIQTIDRGGEHWRCQMLFSNLTGANKAVMKAFLAKLNGQQHRFTLEDHSQIQRGAFGGTPLVAGASQTGTSLNIDGCSFSITNWIREGDMFSVNGDLKLCTADASSNGSGAITVSFTPRILTAPADNAAITTTNPTGVFMLSGPVSSWSNAAGDFSDFSIDCVEDIVA